MEVSMVLDLFGSLLKELAPSLGIAKLEPDSNNSCLIRLESGLMIQIELDKKGEFLLVGADLGTVPPGKYRENLLREALKSNDLPYPIYGILCFSRKNDHLALYEKLPIKDLTGAKIASFIGPFSEKAYTWSAALFKGEVPTVIQPGTTQKPGGLFGLIR
jgi:hypothetical protein